jgi:hypothetical protein
MASEMQYVLTKRTVGVTSTMLPCEPASNRCPTAPPVSLSVDCTRKSITFGTALQYSARHPSTDLARRGAQRVPLLLSSWYTLSHCSSWCIAADAAPSKLVLSTSDKFGNQFTHSAQHPQHSMKNWRILCNCFTYSCISVHVGPESIIPYPRWSQQDARLLQTRLQICVRNLRRLHVACVTLESRKCYQKSFSNTVPGARIRWFAQCLLQFSPFGYERLRVVSVLFFLSKHPMRFSQLLFHRKYIMLWYSTEDAGQEYAVQHVSCPRTPFVPPIRLGNCTSSQVSPQAGTVDVRICYALLKPQLSIRICLTWYLVAPY